jgi:succinoglycan biosynthesis transport protein ExoP
VALNDSTEKKTGLSHYIAIARHHRKWLLGTFGIALIATLAITVLLPPHYRSAGTILIEQQEMPQDFVRSTVTSYADERVQVISKRVMTTETLLNIIRRYDLYPKERASETREALMERMRKDIGLKMISADVIDPRSGHPTSATIAFEVSYTSRSPDLAAKVANELTTLYLNENLNNRTQLARDATSFLESEGDRLNKRIGELEAELAKFKAEHFKQLPELTTLNMQLLDRTDEDVRGLEARKSSLQQQQVYLQAQLAQLKPNSAIFSDSGERILSSSDRLKAARSQLDSARAIYGPDHPDVVRLQREVSGLEKQVNAQGGAAATQDYNDLRRRLESAQAALAAAVERYGPEHPDRVRLQHEVDALQAQIAAAPAASPTSDTHKGPTKDADNPAYIQIQAQYSATVNDLQSVDEQIEKLRVRSTEYQKDLTLAPQVEQRYRELTRDYDNTRIKYQELRSKQSEAKTAQNLESDRKGERFTLIEPPLPPEEPVSPNRKLVFILGFMLSGGLAAGMAWLLETLDTSVRGRMDLFALTGVPPLALVPHIGTQSEARQRRRRLRIAMGSAVASLCIAIVSIHLFYQPLDVLWFSFARRFGL